MADTELNLEAERAAFEAQLPTHWSRERTTDNEGDMVYVDDLTAGAFGGWLMARRSTSSVSEGEMPELPPPDVYEPSRGQPTAYSDKLVREIVRAAIAADRRARQGEPVYFYRHRPEQFWMEATPEQIAHLKEFPGYQYRTLYTGPVVSTKAAAPADAPKWGAVHTVGDMTRNLLTLDQSAPIFTAFHVTIDGERRCRTRGITISRERVIDGKWIDSSRKDVPYTHVIWAKPDERAPAEDAREEVQDGSAPYTESDFMQAAIEHMDAGRLPRAKRCINEAIRLAARRASSVPAIPGTGGEKEQQLLRLQMEVLKYPGIDIMNYTDDNVTALYYWAEHLVVVARTLLAEADFRADTAHPLEAKAGEDA